MLTIFKYNLVDYWGINININKIININIIL